MMAHQASLAALRQRIAVLEEGFGPAEGFPVALGDARVDSALHGGLTRAALHEVYAPQADHLPAAAGFVAALALRAAQAEGRPIVWIRQDMVETECGLLHPQGLADLGLDPDRLFLARGQDGEAVLRAATEAVRCPAVGAVIIQTWGAPRALDFTATRRLGLAAGQSRVPAFLLRQGSGEAPSAAATRWAVRAHPSRRLEADAPGHPAFALTLLRHRAGPCGQHWLVEWNRDRCAFEPAGRGERVEPRALAPLSRPVVSFPVDRPAAQDGLRHAG